MFIFSVSSFSCFSFFSSFFDLKGECVKMEDGKLFHKICFVCHECSKLLARDDIFQI